MQRYVDFIERINLYRNKRIIIWGAGINGRQIAKTLSVTGIKAAYFVDSRQSDGIMHPKCLQTEDRENSLVIVSAHHIPYVLEMNNALERWGWKKNINFINYVEDSIIDENKESAFFDPFLGFSQIRDIEGFTIHGNKYSKNRLVLLGNCTSLCGKGKRSWVDCFIDCLKTKKMDYVLYNGASAGYASSQELLKMIRDVLPLEPKAILVLDGVIDATSANCTTNYPYFTKFEYYLLKNLFAGQKEDVKYKGMQQVPTNVLFGLENTEKKWQHYIRNLRMMRGITVECGIPFFVFLQPSLYCEPDGLLPKEKEIFEIFYRKEETSNDTYLCASSFYKKVCSWIKKEECFYDLTKIFQGWDKEKGAYLDEIHYTEEGSKTIGNIIFRILSNSEKLRNLFRGGVYHEGSHLSRGDAKYIEQRKRRDSKAYD